MGKKDRKKIKYKGEKMDIGSILSEVLNVSKSIIELTVFTRNTIKPMLDELTCDKIGNTKSYYDILRSLEDNAKSIMDIKTSIKKMKINKKTSVMSLNDPRGLIRFHTETIVELYKINVNVHEVLIFNMDNLITDYNGEMKENIKEALKMFRDGLEELKTVKIGG